MRGDVHWDVDELDEVSNETHDRETDSDSLGDLDKLCTQVLGSNWASLLSWQTFVGGLRAPGEELERGYEAHLCKRLACYTPGCRRGRTAGGCRRTP